MVQLAGIHEVAVVDAQAEGIDLAALGELLADPAVVKVFHACPPGRRDIPRTLRRRPLPHLRHPGRRHGRGLRRPGRLRRARRRHHGRQHRQGPPLQRLVRPSALARPGHLRRRRRHLAAPGLRGPVRAPGPREPPGVGAGGDGRPRPAHHLPRRPRAAVGAATAPLEQPPHARPAPRRHGLARARGPTHQHPAPAPHQGREPARDRRQRPRRARRPQPDPRHHPRVRRGEVRRRAPRRALRRHPVGRGRPPRLPPARARAASRRPPWSRC